MDKLLTKKDLAERWQVSERTIDEYKSQGVITPVSKLPCIRYNIEHIKEVEGTSLDKLSPAERFRLEIEIQRLQKENDKLNEIINKIAIASSEIFTFKRNI